MNDCTHFSVTGSESPVWRWALTTYIHWCCFTFFFLLQAWTTRRCWRSSLCWMDRAECPTRTTRTSPEHPLSSPWVCTVHVVNNSYLEEKEKVKIKTIETNRVSLSSFILGGLLIFASKQACPTAKRLFKCKKCQHPTDECKHFCIYGKNKPKESLWFVSKHNILSWGNMAWNISYNHEIKCLKMRFFA